MIAAEAETEVEKQQLLQELFRMGKDAVMALESPMKALHSKYSDLQIKVLDQEKMLLLTERHPLITESYQEAERRMNDRIHRERHRWMRTSASIQRRCQAATEVARRQCDDTLTRLPREMMALIMSNIEQLRQEFTYYTGMPPPEYTDQQLEEGRSELQNNKDGLYEYDPVLNLLIRHPIPTTSDAKSSDVVMSEEDQMSVENGPVESGAVENATVDNAILSEMKPEVENPDRGDSGVEYGGAVVRSRRPRQRKRDNLQEHSEEESEGDSGSDEIGPRRRRPVSKKQTLDGSEGHPSTRGKARASKLRGDGEPGTRSSEDTVMATVDHTPVMATVDHTPVMATVERTPAMATVDRTPATVTVDRTPSKSNARAAGEALRRPRDEEEEYEAFRKKRQRAEVDEEDTTIIEGGRREIDQRRAEERAQKEELLRKRSEELSKTESLRAREEELKRKEAELRRKERELEERKRNESLSRRAPLLPSSRPPSFHTGSVPHGSYTLARPPTSLGQLPLRPIGGIPPSTVGWSKPPSSLQPTGSNEKK
ncbi:hypothetical protein M427DRAFT_52328 [Gonapodya prolifera JEL478]|uniref:Uncharacterized protein n=1 Tax=Gonapodya prolifera (strain JEL478) TaxID=1344416 RepID=A0A139ATP4_GONPJ|nr:hypothetical protein M427DRAFT_52328 [Gonapodya prolifera JEL478]|eukprot:KXS20064.1 hypothetical protein M427DRAFT_52328 [Gonapodya prolifera JEL478]